MAQTSAETTDPGSKKVQVLSDFINSDLNAVRDEYVFQTPFLSSFLGKFMLDKRDMPILNLQLNIIAYLAVGVSALYYINLNECFPLYVRNIIGLAYVVANLLIFEERFILMLHYSSHRPIWDRKHTFLNAYVNWIMAPFYGIPCGVYKLHHVIMHHIENNHEYDISTTETYDRSSLLGFLMYYLRFAIAIYVEIPLYCIKTERWQWFQTVLAGCAVWAASITALANFVNFWATFWVFMMPVFLTFLAMSFGNWSQHIFVDPTKPESNYALTYNCIDTFVNQRTFNDGYHVLHHINGGMHWSEMPAHFHSEQSQKMHQEEGAITFRGLHFFDVGIYVMTGQLHKLAQYYVHLGSKETAPTVDAVVDKFRKCLVRMPPVRHRKGQTMKAKAS